MIILSILGVVLPTDGSVLVRERRSSEPYTHVAGCTVPLRYSELTDR